jgi:hypothetical protein
MLGSEDFMAVKILIVIFRVDLKMEAAISSEALVTTY